MKSPQTALLLLTLFGAAHAQNISSGLSATVTDASQALIANVKVSVRNDRTGFVRQGRTNDSGYFSFPDLVPGTYALELQSDGFKKYRQNEIMLNSGEQRSLGTIVLELGDVSQSVNVTAEAAQVQLGSSEKSNSITQQDLQDLALRGRDVMDAIGLLPGVIDTSEGRDAPSNTSTNDIYIAGGRSNSKNVAVDGVTNLDSGSNGGVHSMPSMDSVSEVKVLLSNYAAEYGRNSGGAITILTRGGSKKFRGSAGVYHKHESYNANNFFNNQRGVDRPAFRYNIGSYTYGGPIYLPKRWNQDRNKLFFFWSQEFQNQRKDYGTRTVTVPTALERIGDFSQSRDTNGRLRVVRDPLTERDASNNKAVFPNNVIPQNRRHPIGKNILNMFPSPNFIDPSPSRLYQWNHIAVLSGSYPRRTEILRLDYQPVTKLQTYLRVSNTRDEQDSPWGLWVNGNVNYPQTPIHFKQPGKGATLHTSLVATPTLFNELIFGVSQNRLDYYPVDPSKIDRAKLGINVAQWNPGLNDGNYIPNMNFGGVQNAANPNLSDGIPYNNSNLIMSLVDNVSKIYKTHTFKFGFYYERTRKDQSANAATRGTLDFGVNALNEYDSNFAYSNAILGSFNSYTEASARPRGRYLFTNFEFYVQDAWRVKRRMLIDYGIRFYANPPTYDTLQQLYSFVPSAYDAAKAPVLLRPALDAARRTVAIDPTNGRTYPEGYIGTFAPNSGDPSTGMVQGGNGLPKGLYDIPKIMAAPRLGFSFDPTGRGRTAIRGGGGVFFDRIQGNMSYNMLPNPPSIFTPTVYYGTLDTLAQTNGKGILAPSGTVRSLFGKNPMPTTYNYSLGVQHQVGKSLLVDLSYVGALSRHQLWQRNINAVPLFATHVDKNPQNANPARPTAALPNNFLRPISTYGDIFSYEFAASSNYNSLQARLTQRFNRNLNWAMSYTLGKALGTSPSDTFNLTPFFSPRDWHYGRLTYDRSHVFSSNFNWTMPYKTLLLRSWQFSGVARAQSGAPFTPSYTLVNGADITGSVSQPARLVVTDPSGPIETRFRAPMRGEFGNLGSNNFVGPGFFNFDIAVNRSFRIGERFRTMFRFETYNTLNHTQYSNYSTATRFERAGATEQIDPLFLDPTSARPARQVQLALRLEF